MHSLMEEKNMLVKQIQYWNNGIYACSTYIGRFRDNFESIQGWTSRPWPRNILPRNIFYICKYFIFAVLGISLIHQEIALDDYIEKKKISIKNLEKYVRENRDNLLIMLGRYELDRLLSMYTKGVNNV